MQTEIEAKFLHVNHNDIRERLNNLGAICEQPMRLMRRVMLDHADQRYQRGNQAERLRVRDEGDKVTVTYKASNETNYPYEVEARVNSFDEMGKLLKALGFVEYSFQESKRETWHYKNVEIVLDEWPWLDQYIEIEGKSEKDIKNVAEKLGFDWKDSKYGSVDTAYMQQYPGMKVTESIGDLSNVCFNEPLPQYLIDRQRK
ncbi:class IV adenylate cyclase [Candidatus Saccharibacteria bacterium]|nr:class IV adenylate cyclase [Candidatus Saccharibacteria bacterium]